MLIAENDLPNLPIRAALDDLRAALAAAGTAVLVAPPGTGKTTVVPLVLAPTAGISAASGPGRVIVAEPRRLAARAAARRMASLLGEKVGDRVGYTVRGDRQVSRATRVEVVTTGVLVRRLQRDPELPGVTTVIIDECHERHLDTDLALAFLAEVRESLRPDLQVLATSATADANRLAALLGAPIVTAGARSYPVETRWSPPPPPIDPPYGLRVDPRLLDHVATTVRRALHEAPGDILVFLPGAREIDAVATRLAGLSAEIPAAESASGPDVTGERTTRYEDVDVLALHGRQPQAVQDAALRAGPRRRVVLATAVAESSLTVPGVRIVVDAGLSRVPRMDHARGLGALATIPVSRASADQRAGRAGREAPGHVYRCWSQAQHDRLPAQPEPEIAAADLTGFALDLALWGHPDGTGLALPDQPPAGALKAAVATLHDLGAVDDDGRVTTRGRALADAGLHPRLARALLDGASLVGARRAAEIVALLDDPRSPTDDLVAAWRRARSANDQSWRTEVRRLTAGIHSPDAPPVGDQHGRLTDDLAAGAVVGLAYPERVGRVREGGGRTYLMAGGTAAELTAGTALAGVAWIAVASADRAPGARTARVRLAAPLDEDLAREVAAALLTTSTEIAWSGGDVVARTIERLGAVPLVERPLTDPDPAAVQQAVAEGLRRTGTGILNWTRAATELRQRLAFARAAMGDPWPDVSEEALLERAADWLDLGRVRRRADLAKIDVAAGLRRLLPWQVAGRLDEIAPERLPVPSGSMIRLDYSDPAAPVLAVKVQEAFGWRDAPRLADGRVPVVLHLLSPAGRPVAVTRDLASFWAMGYAQVRAELRGRYPRHPWPEDPATAEPTRRANPRSR